MGAMKETLGFQTEVRQLLQLMIHSLYSNREIFLRELVSNASDACDKLRYEALDKPELYEGDGELQIRVDFDPQARTLTISDNGIGLSRDEAIEHLGTIAKSGTREFFGRLSGDEARDAQLIGQFGVGFYSAFIVADRVAVVSRRAGLPADQAVRWESDGSGEFSVETVEKPGRGTDVILHLRADEAGGDGETFGELLSGWRLKSIVTKYSDHISLPIRMRREEWDKDKGEYRRLDDWETVNQASALWTRSRSEITDEQYKAFWSHLSHDGTEPLAWTHNRVEGRAEYTQLLYLPAKAPFDLMDRQRRAGLKLYVRRVFIMDDAEQLLPAYLRFVRGVVDSNDLPLNVSREILQESRDVKAIREGCARRVLGMLEDLAENQPEKYAGFWSEFGQVLKEGMGEDFGNRERIAKLLRFASTQSEGDAQTVSLADYLGRMKEGQEKIYYLTADSLQAARSSPHLEVFRSKGVEVLLLTDRVDEWMLSFLDAHEGKELVSVARGGLELGKLEDEEEKKQAEQVAQDHRELTEKVKAELGDAVKEVRVTNRLTDSASCLVSDEGDISGHLERLLKQAGQKAPPRKPILELNPQHPIVARLKDQIRRGEDGQAGDWSRLLLDQAQLAEGGQLEDPAGFVQRLNRMLLSISPPAA
ncbi:molecular chaperone HtpG [Zeimonas arvi]|uniref:Chaperone protein HtpG n=1 Tax=Zeimonas arvi TaxID=2498847 RepID=A0A5C8P1B4_9BURK|nr:molecular chaperone HtpG [Zeimonas arvi]TXL67385.1 molecular chaperone HtpG [Zeimonas arvi]